MKETFPISITLNGKRTPYTPEFQTAEEYAKGWQSVLKRAYGHASLQCQCAGSGKKRISIKSLNGDKFFLARYPSSGRDHSPICQYFDDAPGTGIDGYKIGVIDPQDDGTVKITLDFGMTMRTPANPDSDTNRGTRGKKPGSSQSAMKLFGLLHYLWEDCGLHHWHPGFAGKRKPHTVFFWLNGAAEKIDVGGLRLDTLLLLPATKDSKEARQNQARVAQALVGKNRMLIVATLAAYSPARDVELATRLTISSFYGIPWTTIQAGHWDLAKSRFPGTVAGWRKGQKTVVIAQIELKETAGAPNATVVSMALMGVTNEWIPVESSFEAVVADLLVAQGRSFRKPLSYNAEEEQVLPDFVLTDVGREVPMEVFGRSDAAYLERKAEKGRHYNENYGPTGWWKWDAAADSSPAAIPKFPEKK